MKLLSTSAWGVLALVLATQAHAQQAAATLEAAEVDTLVVTGTRRLDRTAFESAAPVDVVSQEALKSVVSDEIMDKLAATTPSFNVQRLPAADVHLLTPVHQLVIDVAGDQGVQAVANMDIGTGLQVFAETDPDGVLGPGHHDVSGLGGKAEVIDPSSWWRSTVTATNGASSTRILTFSAGVTR